MNWLSTRRPSPALIVAMAALVMAMSGAAIALPGKGKVETNDIENGAVTKKKIAKGAVGSAQIVGKSIKGNRLKDGAVNHKQLKANAVTEPKIADQAVTAAKVKSGSLTGAQVAAKSLSSGNIADYAVIGNAAGPFVRVVATEGASEVAARDAAPLTQLFKKGQLTVSAKCFHDTSGGTETRGEIYIQTSANGAFFTSFTDSLVGGNAAADFLNTDSALVDSTLVTEGAPATDAGMDQSPFSAHAADGTTLTGQLSVAAKNGALAGGNGAYGEGNVCLFGGQIAG